MFSVESLKQLVPSDRKNSSVLSVWQEVQLKANNILEWHISRRDFFKETPLKLNVSIEYIWNYMTQKHPNWFTQIFAKKAIRIEWILKIEYSDKFLIEISKFKKK